MTGRQVGEEVRSLAVKWLMRLNLWQGDRMTRRQVGEEVISQAVKWVEEAQSLAGRQDDKKTSG